ncbi:sensor histidine kinase [Methylobacterium sp. J-076]|uniref:sensor histidine kinase n=1 Tax=Methylobacterium sp. J-076 TaxID=2836655 RepID=UPI001FB9B837|nr:HAMP domain-containing sensor histidine kinase [Methylobacterium sp. J-076]MCJ2013923.1 HAMP domain-containing histidine kinase [Methylobacterium sp. J-076]
MENDEARLLIRSSSPHERLTAARHIRRSVTTKDLPLLRAVLRDETVVWVRKALIAAIGKAEDSLPPQVAPAAQSEEDATAKNVKQIHARAVEEVAATLLHEFQPIVGVLRLRAQEEVPAFDKSGVKVQLDRLDSLFTAIETLKIAASTPRRRQFDLAMLVDDVAREEGANYEIKISTTGPRPFIIESDPSLIKLVISNGLRNALEGVVTVPQHEDSHPVIINWGATDIEIWLAIMDRGPGLGTNMEGAFNVGSTTKRGHSGMGLAIARQAMDSLEGEIALRPSRDVGAHFEIKWFK